MDPWRKDAETYAGNPLGGTEKSNDNDNGVGTIANTLTNLFGGAVGVAGDLLNGIGANLDAWDEAGREQSYSDSIKNSDRGFLGNVGDWLTNNGQYLDNIRSDINNRYGSLPQYQNMGLVDRLTNLDYLANKRGFLADVANGFGSSIPFLLAGELAPEVKLGTTGLDILGSLGSKGSKLAEWGAKNGIGNAVDSVATYGITTGPLDAFTNAAGTYSDLKQMGLSDQEIANRINSATAEELPYDIGLEGLSQTMARGGLFGKMFSGKGRARRIAGNALNVPTEMGNEYFQESMQQRMNNKYTDKPYGTWYNPTQDERNAGVMGAISALPLAGFGSVHGYFKDGANNNASFDQPDLNGSNSSMESSSGDQSNNGTDPSPEQYQEDMQANNSTQEEVNTDVSDLPMQNIEDAGLSHTNNALKGKYRELYDWAHDQFGKDMVVSGGWRSPENNAANHGADNSHHLYGDAIDVDYSMFTDEEKDAIKQKARELGFNRDGDGIEDNHGGNGMHMHLTYEDDGSAQDDGFFPSSGNSDYDAWISQYSNQYNVPQNILYSLLNTESGFNPEAKSGAGAIGIAQFMPGTAEAMGIDPTDAQQSIEGAAKYLKEKFDKYGDWHTALEAYNGGDGNVGSGATKEYADKVMSDAGNIKGSKNSSNTSSHKFKLDDGSDKSLEEAYAEYAAYQKDTSSDPKTINLFSGMFSTDRKGNDVFDDTPENRKAIDEKYGDDFKQFVYEKNMRQDLAAMPNTQEINTPSTKTADQSASPINIPNKYVDKAKMQQELITAPPASSVSQRKEQGKAILLLAAGKGTNIEPKLATGLKEGYARAITTAQERLANSGMTEAAAQAIINERMSNNENQSTAAPVSQNSNTENINENTIPQAGQTAAEENKNKVAAISPANKAKVITDNGSEMDVHYRVVPADDLVTSNYAQVGMPVNKNYPAELQPRNRQRKSMDQQITEIAQNIRPEDLAESRNLNQGAPIVRDDNVVLNGNGRTISIIRALKGSRVSEKLNKSAKKYHKFLVNNAEKFGLNKQEIIDMIKAGKQPVLVRQIDGKISDKNMHDIISSTAGGSRMGASEQAKADAKNITMESLDRYVENENGDITTAHNRDFVAGILYNIVSKNDINAFLDKNGNINADGIQRVKRALFYLAYGDDDLISKMAESTDDNTRNISNALMSAAPEMARLNIKIRDGIAYPIELAKTISEATKRLDYLRQQGQTVENYLSSQSMFDEYKDTKEMKEVLKYFDDNKRRSKKIGKFISRSAEIIDAMGDPNQETLIHTDEKTFNDIIQQAEGDVENGGQSSLFMDEGREAGSNEALQPGQRERKENVQPVVQERPAAADESVHVHGGQIETYRSRTDTILKQFNNKEINKSQASQSLKDIMGDANKDYFDRKISPAEKDEVQAYANDALGEINKQQVDKSRKRKEQKNKASSNRVFTDTKTADDAMLKAFGIAKKEAPKKSKHSWAHKSDDEKAALKDQISKELNNISAMPMFNPKLMVPAFKLAAAYIDDGIVKFSEFSSKMVGDLGEKIRPWLKSMWNAAASYDGETLDEGKLTMMLQSVGARYDDGLHTYQEIYDDISSLVGKDNAKSIEPYVKSAFNSVEAYYNDSIPAMKLDEGEDENGTDGSTDRLAARAGEGNDKNPVGGYDESAGSEQGSSGKGLQSSGTEVRPQRSVRVQDSSASSGGTAGNSGVQAEESADRSGGTRSSELPGGIRDSYEGDASLDDGRKGRDVTAPEIGRKHESDSLKTKTETKAKAGSLEESIKKDLPMLLPEQRNDVVFIERRLQESGKQGVLLTNGTGTGKTFSGLGAIKRMVDSGKENILIVTPGSEINKQWIEAAKKFFGINIHELESEQDAGKGVTITTYANYGSNNELVNRDWDMIVHDESQKLMENEKGDPTNGMKKLRALTYHHDGLRNRFKLIHAKEYSHLEKLRKEDTVSSKRKEEEILVKLNKEFDELEEKWKNIPIDKKPKVIMMSATPFSHVKNIEYGEGYLFDYGKDSNPGSYRNQTGRDTFFIQHFGYRMRDGKLSRPEANVDNSLMEMEFNEWLKSTGAAAGRSIDIDVDYDRGFLLTPNAVGALMDKGFDALHNKKYQELEQVINKNFNSRKRNYLLEYIKAKEVIPIIREYLKQGKKVVLFHQSMKSTKVANPFLLSENSTFENDDIRDKVMRQYEEFKKENPYLYYKNMGMDGLLSPVKAIEKAFGDKVGFYNGQSKNKVQEDQASIDKRSRDVREFNDDNGTKKIIMVQQDAGNAGISLHDTTGKFQRVLINLAIPQRPTYAIQTEGRIYRVGSKTNAIFRYMTTGTNVEKSLFASTVASRAGTAENLSMGSAARNLRDSFRDLYMETMDGSWESRKPGSKTEGTGGKAMDSAVNDAITEFDKAKTYYYGQQKKTGKTKAIEGKDYFATPEPLGFKMVEWSQTPKGGRILEPSAGHGAISRWFSPDTDQTIIEPSGNLAPLAQMVTPNAKVINDTFENHNLINKYDSIIMNPPFGSGGKTAIDHVAKAFKHLKDGGRLVAIIPDGPSCMKHLDKWLYGNPEGKTKAERGEEDAVLMRTINLPAATFERAGTKVQAKLIIIDKYSSENARSDAAAEAGGELDLRDAKNINELFDRIENMEAPKRVSTSASLRNTSNPVEVSPVKSEDGKRKIDIDGHTVILSDDGYVSGDTYSVKNKIKQSGAKWDPDARSWYFSDKVKMKKFINEYSDEKVEITEEEKKTAETLFSLPNGTTAGLNRSLDYRSGFTPLKSLAKRLGGDYKKSVGFVFADTESRDQFVKEAEAFMGEGENSFNSKSAIEQIKLAATFPTDSELNKQQKAIVEYGKSIGCPVVFIDANSRLNGFHSRGITFINRQAGMSLERTFWHETMHWMANNNQELFGEMMEYIKGSEEFSPKEINEYRESVGQPNLSDDAVIEEMMADTMLDVKRRVEFMRGIGRKNMNLAQRFIAWIRDRMNDFADFFHTPVNGLTTQQRDAMVRSFSRMAASMTNMDGQKIFRVSNRTNEIQLASGKPLAADKYSLDNIKSNGNEYHDGNPKSDSTKYSITKQDKSFFDKAKAKLMKKMSLSNDNVEVHETVKDANSMNPWRRYIMSPSRVAAKVPQFKLFFEYADRAMHKLTSLRSDYARKLDSAMKLVKNKEDRQALYGLLAQGDAEGKEFTQKELLDDGVNENVAQAYKQVRQLMTKAYIMLNDARRRVQVKSERIDAKSKRMTDLLNNKFVTIMRETNNADGSTTITYKEAANWKKKYDGVTQDALDLMENDDAMQILSTEDSGVNEDGEPIYHVETRESIPDIHKLTGYIPHFFHEYMVRLRVNTNGGISYKVVGSGRTVKEAVKLANDYAEKNNIGDDAKLVVSPKVFDFSSLGMDESQYAAVMGDNDYNRMVSTLAANNDMTLPEAKEMVKGAAKMKNRHRFFGNFLQRKGAEGYEKDMNWVLRHYFNSACRYTALETEFKPKAISLFERIHGDFNKEYKGMAQYTKEYINDINGVPSAMEDSINTMLNNNIFWRRWVASNFGDRAALALANEVTNKVSILKLGFLNVSSALINFTQAANAAAYIGDPKALYQAILKGAHRKYSMKDLRVLVESGVMNDIGLDSGSGYGKFSAGKWASRSMILFKTSERIIRRGTVLAAYNEGIKRGMNHKQAIEFAKDVNRKSNFDYGVHDAPNMFRRGSIISQLLLQFKKYPVKELEVMRDMLPVFSNSTSAKQKALFWGTYFLMAGLCQVPFGDWWDDFLQMFGLHPKDSFKKGLMEWAGKDAGKKKIAEIMMYGAGSLAGVDISSRTGIADVIPTKMSDALGPTVSTMKQFFQADGTLQRIRALSPGLSNIIMAAEGKSIGARGRVGSEYNTPMDKILRALGFRSTDEAIESDIQSITYNQRSEMTKDKQKAVDEYLDDPTTDNAKRLKELGIKPDTVKKERDRKKNDKLGRTTSGMSKEELKNNKTLLEFAK